MGEPRAGNTVEEIYLALRERIIDGTYAPGFRMSQGGLAEELAVSRTPLREALHRLEADGLLVAEANRGMQVAPTSIEDVEQYYAIRLLVEPPTIAAIIDELTEDDLDTMARDLETMKRDSNRIRDFQEAHLRFHQTTLRRYPTAIRDLTQSLHLKIFRHQRLYFSRPHASEDFTDVDALFLEAMRAGDGVLAREVMEFHLVDAAMGLVLDSEPDHAFGALLLATRGVGIDLATTKDKRIERPTQIRWLRADARTNLGLATTNLECGTGTGARP